MVPGGAKAYILLLVQQLQTVTGVKLANLKQQMHYDATQ